jgi:hypothetical protein
VGDAEEDADARGETGVCVCVYGIAVVWGSSHEDTLITRRGRRRGGGGGEAVDGYLQAAK